MASTPTSSQARLVGATPRKSRRSSGRGLPVREAASPAPPPPASPPAFTSQARSPRRSEPPSASPRPPGLQHHPHPLQPPKAAGVAGGRRPWSPPPLPGAAARPAGEGSCYSLCQNINSHLCVCSITDFGGPNLPDQARGTQREHDKEHNTSA